MDYQNPPEIVITHTEKHPVREEVIEHVARLLARADGKDPDEDTSCVSVDGTHAMTCFIYTSLVPRMWHKYREPAEKLLAQIFTPQIDPDPPTICLPSPRGYLGLPPYGSFGDVAPLPSEGFVPNGIDLFPKPR